MVEALKWVLPLLVTIIGTTVSVISYIDEKEEKEEKLIEKQIEEKIKENNMKTRLEYLEHEKNLK